MAAASVIRDAFGVDLMSGLRGYKTAKGALKKILKSGKNLEAVVKKQCKKHGWKQKPKALAKRGYLAFMEVQGGDGINAACGVVVGREAAFPTDKGWHLIPLTSVKTVFGHE